MKQLLLVFLLCFVAAKCMGVDYYWQGDTLWVWAKSGLNIREKPDAKSKILDKIVFGGQIVVSAIQERDFPYSIEEIKTSKDGLGLELTGYWAKVKYKNIEGYVFDAYLSKLPPMAGHVYEPPTEEDFHVLALKKHSELLRKEVYVKSQEETFTRYIFEKGYLIERSSRISNWEKYMLFTGGLSLLEGYLIYANTIKGKGDILIEKSEDQLIFQIETGTLTIRKVRSFLIIYEEHAC